MRAQRLALVAIAGTLTLAPAASASTLMGSDLTATPNYGHSDLRTYTAVEGQPGSSVAAAAPVSGVLVAMKLKHNAVAADSEAPAFKFRIMSGTGGGGTWTFTARPATPDGSIQPTLTIPPGSPAGIATY